jgi:hypothetical protein
MIPRTYEPRGRGAAISTVPDMGPELPSHARASAGSGLELWRRNSR